MQKRVLYIGLDVDDNKFHGYCICEKTGEALNEIKKGQLTSLGPHFETFASRHLTLPSYLNFRNKV